LALTKRIAVPGDNGKTPATGIYKWRSTGSGPEIMPLRLSHSPSTPRFAFGFAN